MLKESLEIIKNIRKGEGIYLFSLISGKKLGFSAYKEYQRALNKFNNNLIKLSKEVGLNYKITSYTIRHSFATSLKNLKVPIEVISEMLGHRSIKTTQIYLKSFSLDELFKANNAMYKHVTR